eukprot:gene33107-59911_t
MAHLIDRRSFDDGSNTRDGKGVSSLPAFHPLLPTISRQLRQLCLQGLGGERYCSRVGTRLTSHNLRDDVYYQNRYYASIGGSSLLQAEARAEAPFVFSSLPAAKVAADLPGAVMATEQSPDVDDLGAAHASPQKGRTLVDTRF